MDEKKLIFFDGETMKGVNLPFSWDDDFGWDVLGGKKTTDKELYYRVAAVFRAAQLNAQALCSLSFALIDAQGNDYDTSEDWQNKVGFLPRPLELFRLWRNSLFMTNAAYGFMETTRQRGRLLRYITPDSITPIVDAQRGITAYKRTLGTQTQTYPADGGPILAIHRLDWDTELLPSEATEFAALANAAGIAYWADMWTKHYFKRGGIRPTMLLVKGVNPNREERQKLESVWQRFISGIGNFGKVFNANEVEPKVIGDGVGEMGQSDIYRQALENVSMASGIPLSLLVANSANFATAQAELSTWFEYSIVPFSRWFADELNNSLFARLRLRLEFRPEKNAPDAERDLKRTQIFVSLVQNNVLPAAAAEIAGIELPPGWTYDTIFKPEEQPEEVTPPVEPATQEVESVPVAAEPESLPVAKSGYFFPDAEQVRELGLWRDFAERKMKKGLSPVFEFEAKYLPEWYADAIRARLAEVKAIEDVPWAFSPGNFAEDLPAQPARASTDALLSLAEAINAAANAEKKEIAPSMPNITITMPGINLTAQMPAVGAPDVIVQLPEQPAPQVTVINEVQPASVKVENQVNVAPADVELPEPPKSARITRDIDGRTG